MKRLFVLLLACVLVFSIMVSISACKPKPTPDNPTPDQPGTETPEDEFDKSQVEGTGDGIQLPIVPINPSVPENTEGEDTEGESTEG